MPINVFEPEETIGALWHKLVGGAAGAPVFPDKAAAFADLRPRLGVFFRGLGGDPGIDLKAIAHERTGHRLKWRERLGHDHALAQRARIDGDTLFLPGRLDALPDLALNADLYFWLTAWAAAAGGEVPETRRDPLQADMAYLRHAERISRRTLFRFAGLRPRYKRLSAGLLALRPKRSLPKVEEQLEACITALLGGPQPQGEAAAMLTAIVDADLTLKDWRAPYGYKPHMPVALWGESLPRPERSKANSENKEEPGRGGEDGEETAHRARRRKADQAERKDSLILHRFESILSFAEMMNLNRDVEDEDEDTARKAADDMDEISLVNISRKAATKLKFHLDLSPQDVDRERLSGECLYPEWDYRKNIYYDDHCRVLTSLADEAPEGQEWRPNAASLRRIRAVRRQFEALRPKREILPRQLDGAEFDMDALVRSQCDFRAQGEGSDRIYLSVRQQARDLAVAVLIDTSRSTESWIEGRQVIEVAREALAALTQGLAACGDDYAIYSFSSLKRDRVYVSTLKGFDEPPGPRVLSRIGALKPGFYTRLGAAVRHVAGELEERPNQRRLLLVITDGKPNDLDHYEGRYGVEDTARAIREARRQGLTVFGVTIDARAQSYFPYIFGRNAFSIVSHAGRLTQALPLLYRHLVA